MEGVLATPPHPVWGGMLTNQADANAYRLLPTLRRGIKVGKISRKEVASYLIDEAERKENLGKRVTLT